MTIYFLKLSSSASGLTSGKLSWRISLGGDVPNCHKVQAIETHQVKKGGGFPESAIVGGQKRIPGSQETQPSGPNPLIHRERGVWPSVKAFPEQIRAQIIKANCVMHSAHQLHAVAQLPGVF